MKSWIITLTLIIGWLAQPGFQAKAESLDATAQAKVDKKIAVIQAWAADPVIVNAVKAQNASTPADYQTMTQDKWAQATIMDPLVRSLTKNEVGQFLKSKKDDVITEAFVSDANGLKVGFLSKTTNWSHKGKAKHEDPMAGKIWQGAVETDASTGLIQVQIAVPIMDGGKAIGSMVVGLSVSKLDS
ncbi:MAG TPA: hypothetical protein VF607_12245 [Verrucomicrobiae bacterium]